MATDVSATVETTHDQHQEVLSDEQIELLIQEAEARLGQKINLEIAAVPEPQIKMTLPKLQHGLDRPSYIREHNGVARADLNLFTKTQRKMADELRPIEARTESKKTNDVTSSGPDWFNLPKTELTPQLKRDLQLIEMRNVLDPHRHYKKNTRRGQVPTFSQVGTVIEGPTEYYSSRINKKDRSKNFVEETMKTEQENGRFKRKYSDIQEAKSSGKKAHYKKLMSKRKKSS